MNALKKPLILVFGCSFLMLWGQSCTPSKTAENNENPPVVDTLKTDTVAKVEEPKVIEFDPKFNDVARVLAGMPVDSNSAYYEVTQNAYWKQYAQGQDNNWKQSDAKRFNAMRNWAETELKDLNAMEGDIFYPFSGPDIYYAYQFFPSAKAYHLFALEPAGDLTFLDKKDAKWQAYCSNVHNAIADFFVGGFFHTKHMKGDMQMNGVAPVLAVFLVRSGNTITNVESVTIQPDGSVAKATDGKFNSVRIDFLDAKTKELKSMYYHSCDVSDEGLQTRTELMKHLQKVAANRTFTKSASYLMHRPNFSKIRDLITEKAVAVFQDDTAIPHKYYDATKWNFRFYGKYTGPIKLFDVRMQDDLRKLYQTEKTYPLPFSLGYHSSHDHDNMVVITRK